LGGNGRIVFNQNWALPTYRIHGNFKNRTMQVHDMYL